MDFKILIDKKESNNEHILKEFNTYSVSSEKQGLLLGEYAIKINDTILPVAIKRIENYLKFKEVFCDHKIDPNKNNKFFRDIKRASENGTEIILLVEDLLFLNKLFSDAPLRNKVIELETNYNIKIVPIDKKLTGKYIYLIAHYKTKNHLKNQ